MTETITQDFETMLDEAPDYAKETAALVRWSTNYNYNDEGNPLPLFLDLIGYNEEQFGESSGRKVSPLGFVELGYLGDALREYAERPQDIWNWLERLFASEIDN
jgi:hypothetical protein